jgi:hypothetical protein
MEQYFSHTRLRGPIRLGRLADPVAVFDARGRSTFIGMARLVGCTADQWAVWEIVLFKQGVPLYSQKQVLPGRFVLIDGAFAPWEAEVQWPFDMPGPGWKF